MIQTYFLNYRPAMKEIKLEKRIEAELESDKFVMEVEEPKNLASKKRKKKNIK